MQKSAEQVVLKRGLLRGGCGLLRKKLAQLGTGKNLLGLVAVHGFLAVLLCGCRTAPEPAGRRCYRAESASRLLQSLSEGQDSYLPLRAGGQCLLEYYDDRGQRRKENFPVRLWIEPPSRIALLGDVGFDGRAIVFGCNEQEFWLAAKPKQISGYWWGRWSENGGSAGQRCLAEWPMGVGPYSLLEGFGLVGQRDGCVRWELSRDARFDVLNCYDQTGRLAKKIYIDCCDSVVRKVQYFDAAGQQAAQMELDGYRQVAEGFLVPTAIKISRTEADAKGESIRISLNSVQTASFSDTQRRQLFTPLSSQPFERVYRLDDNCRFIREN